MKNIFRILIISLLAFSCREFSDGKFNGPDQVGWGKAFQGSINKYIEEVATGDDDLDSLEIQLIGRQSNDPIAVNFSLSDQSTAIEGVHFDFVTTGGSVTIEPNTSSAYVYFNVISDNFSIDEDFNLVLDIESADVEVSANLETVTHNMSIACASDLAGTYDFTSSGLADPDFDGTQTPYNVSGSVTLVEEVGVGAYEFDDMSFGLYPQVYGDTAPAGSIQDVCGDLSGIGDTDQYGDPFTISATVNGDGSIDLTWSNTFGDTGTVALTPQ